jgi:hypothetical protein
MPRRPLSGLDFAHLLLFSLLVLSPVARGDDHAAEANAFFENEIRPLLAEQCIGCHGPQKQKGGLRLDSLAAALQGGGSGPAVVPGKTEESLLVEAVHYDGLEMPPAGKLADDQVTALTRWVELGAPWPGPGGDEASPEAPPNRSGADPFTAEERAYWAFQPVRDPQPPAVAEGEWASNPIDRFLIDRMAREGLSPSPRADRVALIRRATFDLIGLPPSPEEIDQFVADPAPDEEAFAAVVDRLLASPRYGERWGRHWLDLVRYAESNGYRADEYRPHAWRYRDYVIDSLNQDKPYDQFIREQLAGDEIAPADPAARVATGYLRLWIYESNQRDVKGQWETILADVTDVTADVFLGLGMGCARCHDHKYDPILQKDYYRLQAFFTPLLPRDDLTIPKAPYQPGADERRAAWEVATAEIRGQVEKLIEKQKKSAEFGAVTKFQPDMQAMLGKPREARTPLEKQLADLAYRQIQMEYDKIAGALKGEAKERYQALMTELAKFDHLKPDEGPPVETISDVGVVPPPTIIPGDRSRTPVEPGFLSLLDPAPASLAAPAGWPESTGRRRTLANWIASAENPLTARVMVNRVWQQHFGRGLVETPSDFGKLGEAPSHPELLDWLASRFVEDGWSLKTLHRRMMLSAAYAQGTENPGEESARRVDPTNRLVWTRPVRRVEAESIRDAMLATSGELKLGSGGPSADSKEPRRTVYTKVLRNKRDPLLDAFDGPDGYFSTSVRNVTTTPTQSLLMINGAWTLARAEAFARRLLEAEARDDRERVGLAYRLAFGREAEESEVEEAMAFLATQSGQIRGEADAVAKACENPGPRASVEAWTDLAHAILNANEFLYVD